MKEGNNLKANQRYAHLMAIVLYAIGIFLDIYGHLNGFVEFLAYIFLATFMVYAISLAIIWDTKNTRILKGTWVHFLFVIAGIIMLFVSHCNNLYPTFVFTLIFMAFICIAFGSDLYKICNAYINDKWE